ncbi:MAG TPA: potassium-transporting ATPase subunit KdpC [Ignavibacteria bacterium]
MKTIITALKLLLFMTLLTGIIYPLFIFLIAKTVFPQKSEGSFVKVDDKIIGSELFGQKFESKKYFQSRPSAVDYQPMPSGGSNLAPTSQSLKSKVDSLRQAYIIFNELPVNTDVPSDAVFSSASGIDPHISPVNALLQSDRVSKERNFDTNRKKQLADLIKRLTEGPQFGFLGEPRINVLNLNLALDKL